MVIHFYCLSRQWTYCCGVFINEYKNGKYRQLTENNQIDELAFFIVSISKGINKTLLLRRQFPGGRNGHRRLFTVLWFVI
jgi:hypothetical protein